MESQNLFRNFANEIQREPYIEMENSKAHRTIDNAIIPLKISQLAKLVAKNKRVPISSALSYIYDSPFYEQLYNEEAKWWYLDTESLYRKIEQQRSQAPKDLPDKVITFLTFCVEKYAQEHKMTSLQSYALFRKYKVDTYLTEGFDVLHTQGADAIIQDIDIYLQNHIVK